MPDLNENVRKLHHTFDQLDLLFQLKTSNLSDFNKRAVLRFYFIGIDNFLKLIGWIKNETRRNRKLSAAEVKELERLISVLRTSYEAAYDLIRDKLTAHQQELDLVETITWWNEIDSDTIGIFQSDVLEIRSLLVKAYPPLAIGIDPLLLDWSDEHPSTNFSRVQMNVTRLSMAIPNAVSLLPGVGSQQKAAMVSAALRFIRSDFYFTLKGQNWTSKQQYLLFEIGWLLVIIDITSILDCIYDNAKELSLLTLWTQERMEGASVLARFSRDHSLEVKMREVRNKFAAHLDSALTLDACRKLLIDLDLQQIYEYCTALANAFLDGCHSDIRTRLFLVDGMEIRGVISVSGNASKPFGS